MKTVKALLAKYRDVISYLFFGVLTTVVDWIVTFACHDGLGISPTVSTVIAWVVAVIFAYLTNKPFVFKSHDWSWNVVWPELTKFVGCRIGSGVLETGILFLAVDFLGWNGNVWKIVTAVLVIVLNYIGSKFLVFKNK